MERWQADERRREDEKGERIRAAQLRGADTRRRRTRFKAFRTFLQLARTDERQISVALISKKSGISPAAFYENFKQNTQADSAKANQQQHGIGVLLEAACEQIAQAATRELFRQKKLVDDARRDGNSDVEFGKIRRVTITLDALIRLLGRYPNLFNVEGKIPRTVIIALSRTLSGAITLDEGMSDHQQREAEIMAIYHTTALIGIFRSGLGSMITPTEYVNRLVMRTASQIIPVLLLGNDAGVDAELARLIETPPPALLRITELKSYRKVVAMQMEALHTSPATQHL